MTAALKATAWRHRGMVEAVGMVLDAPWVDPAARCKRVLDHWEPGARLEALPHGGWVLWWPHPRRVDAGRCDGTPLVPAGAAAAAVPLLHPTAAPAGAVVTLGHGVLRAVPPAERTALDPATWLDLRAFTTAQPRPLGGPQPLPAVHRPPALDVRRAAGLAAPDDHDTAVMAALQTQRAGPGADARSNTPGLWQRAAHGAQRRWDAVRTMARASAPGKGRRPTRWRRWWSKVRNTLMASDPADPPTVRIPRLPPPEAAAAAPWWRRAFSQLAWRSALGRWLGQVHGRHLARTLELLEEGDLDEALRRAIPLSKVPGDAGPLAPPPLLPPGRRADLSIRPHRGARSSSLGLGAVLFERLRQLYRQAFERLDAQGRHDEAAFVLAELLGDTEEATAYLERHARLNLAAQLAEGRGAAPGLVVRLWMLAGETGHAVLLARRHGAFADAVTRLRQRNPALSDMLRVLWADAMAESGDLLGAARVAVDVAAHKELVMRWLDMAVDRGGIQGMRARLMRLGMALEPAMDSPDARAVLGALDGQSDDDTDLRAALLVDLAEPGRWPQLAGLGSRAVRTALRDGARGLPGVDEHLAARLMEKSADGLLRADLPAWPRTRGGWLTRNQALAVVKDSSERGAHAVADAAALPQGRLLVALGEAGVALLTRDGRRVAHFDAPADQLCVCVHPDRALAVAHRGTARMVTQLDLAQRTCTPWLLTSLDAWAAAYDGSGWLVAHGQEVLLLDATAPVARTLWRVPALGEAVRAVHWAPSSLSVTLATEAWRYQVPQMALRDRIPLDWRVPRPSLVPGPVVVDARGHVARTWLPDEDAPAGQKDTLSLEVQHASGRVWLEAPGVGVGLPQVSFEAPWLACVTQLADPPQSRVMLFHAGLAAMVAQVSLLGVRQVRVRLQPDALVVMDDTGLVETVDLRDGRLGSVRVMP